MSRDGYLPPGVSHLDVEYAAGWRPKKEKKQFNEFCYACGRGIADKNIGKFKARVINEDTIVFVGPECYKNITTEGWQPKTGGPKLCKVD